MRTLRSTAPNLGCSNISPVYAKLTRPASKAASQSGREEEAVIDVEPLSVVSHSAQGTMCEARSKAGSVMPVIGHRPFQYSSNASRKMFCPTLLGCPAGADIMVRTDCARVDARRSASVHV